MNDDTKQINMRKFRGHEKGREDFHYHEREGGGIFWPLPAQSRKRGEFQAD